MTNFRDILGERTLDEEEEDVQVSWLHFYKYYVFVVIPFIIDVIFLCYEQRPKANLNYMAFRAINFKAVITLIWKVEGDVTIKIIFKATKT